MNRPPAGTILYYVILFIISFVILFAARVSRSTEQWFEFPLGGIYMFEKSAKIRLFTERGRNGAPPDTFLVIPKSEVIGPVPEGSLLVVPNPKFYEEERKLLRKRGES